MTVPTLAAPIAYFVACAFTAAMSASLRSVDVEPETD
jgi:hypothetical protein